MGGMTRLLLLLWAGVTVGSLVDLQKRNVGGHDCTKDDKRGYHVFLTFESKTKVSFCGGSLISDQWILTAAHCWKPGRTVTAVFGGRLDSGDEMTLGPDHEIFKDENGREHDIMLLKLPNTKGIPPVPLPLLPDDCANKPKINVDEVQIAGYASTAVVGDIKKASHKIKTSEPLQCANTKVVKCTKCQGQRFVYPHLLCYQNKGKGVDTTGGDSGGGVVFNGKIYGVHVGGGERVCDEESQAVDICADEYKVWINKTTKP